LPIKIIVALDEDVDFEGGLEMDNVETAVRIQGLMHGVFTDVEIVFEQLVQLFGLRSKRLYCDIGIGGESWCAVERTGD